MADDMILTNDGGVAEVEITIGYAQIGWFELGLYANNAIERVIARGPYRTTPHRHQLGDPDELNGKFLGWRVTVGAATDKKEPFEVRIEVTQNGHVVENGRYVRRGEMEGGKAVYDNAELVVAS